ncbi:MAG: dTDP-4-dehydrorhamnose 3,5-epimerase family protein [bacterium]|nr:dTDP-4-dehydrorhamnose 3,5-epimerase family protein [bacterium]
MIRQLEPFTDSRGWLIEIFRHDELPAEFHPVMCYLSMTRPGVTRGPHEHREQADLFAFLGPSTFRLYLWDTRPESETFKTSCRFDFGETNRAIVIVPPGVVHAYKNIGTVDGIVYNAPNRLYAGWGRKEAVDEIRHENDPDSPFRLD